MELYVNSIYVRPRSRPRHNASIPAWFVSRRKHRKALNNRCRACQVFLERIQIAANMRSRYKGRHIGVVVNTIAGHSGRSGSESAILLTCRV
jgi:hypothetical protein